MSYAIYAPGVGMVRGTIRPTANAARALLTERLDDCNDDVSPFPGERISPYFGDPANADRVVVRLTVPSPKPAI